jgi:hypothetical protein
MTDTEANKKFVDAFTQGLFSEGDLEAVGREGAAIGLGDELRAAVWAGAVPVCSVPVPRRLLALGECVGGHEESRDPAGWAGSTL